VLAHGPDAGEQRWARAGRRAVLIARTRRRYTVHLVSMLWYGDGRRSACAEAPARDRWVVRSSPYGAAPGPMRRLAFLEGRRGGEPAARGSGTVLHGRRGDAVAGAQRVAQPGRQNARRAGGALERGCAAVQSINATLTAFFSKKLNRSAQSGE
jgi:hypothetical protein